MSGGRLRLVADGAAVGLPRQVRVPEDGDRLHEQHLMVQRDEVEVDELRRRPQLRNSARERASQRGLRHGEGGAGTHRLHPATKRGRVPTSLRAQVTRRSESPEHHHTHHRARSTGTQISRYVPASDTPDEAGVSE